jgi:mannosyltransferase
MIVIDGIIFSLQRAGGISVIFQNLLNYLDSKAIPTTLLLNESVEHVSLEYSGGLKIKQQQRRLLERYRPCLTPDCSIFHSSYYRLPDNPHIKSVVTVYDFMYERFRKGPAKWIHSNQKISAIQRAQSIICISNSTYSDLLNYVNVKTNQSVHVIHLAASDDFRILDNDQLFKLKIKITNRPFLLFVGSRSGYKNFKLALKTLELLPDFSLICIGGGDFKSIEFEECPEQVVNRTHHLGFISNKFLNQLYNMAVALIYPSSYEGFGIPILEAMKAGCPVICINCKAAIEIGGDAVLVSLESNPSELVKAVHRALSNDRQEIVKRGLKNANLYSWNKTCEQTIEVYKNLKA